MFSSIRTVFLDLDNTLWWFSRNSATALSLVCARYQVEARCTRGEQRFVQEYESINAHLWHQYHHGEISREQLIGVRYTLALQAAGYVGDDADSLGQRMDKDYLSLLAEQPLSVPGARELLEYLTARGYQIGVLSNGFKQVQRRKLESASLSDLVPLMVLSDDCGITKPRREIFDYALRIAGAGTSTTVMIGDDPDADIFGAHRAGWRTIFFNPSGRLAVPGTADAEVKSLLEVTHLL